DAERVGIGIEPPLRALDPNKCRSRESLGHRKATPSTGAEPASQRHRRPTLAMDDREDSCLDHGGIIAATPFYGQLPPMQSCRNLKRPEHRASEVETAPGLAKTFKFVDRINRSDQVVANLLRAPAVVDRQQQCGRAGDVRRCRRCTGIAAIGWIV